MIRTKFKNMEIPLHINIRLTNYKSSTKKLEGKEYLVVPVTMMVEGVHNGSQGSVLHEIDELGRVPDSWNGIPIIINHPMKDGKPVSANVPEVLDSSAIGKVFNTFVEDQKLKAEAWFDIAKMEILAAELLELLKDGKAVEVSVGAFSDYEQEEGDWNGEHYTKIALNHRPDHLAILPDMQGACSITDGCGCGFGINSEGSQPLAVLRKIKEDSTIYAIQVYKTKKEQMGLRALMDAIFVALRGMDKNGTYSYLEEAYDTYIVYSLNDDKGTRLYKQDYEFEGGKVELIGNPVEVHRKVEYIVNHNFKKEVNMSSEVSPCLKKKVDTLITNSQGKWTEEDREFLQELSEVQLDKMAPIIVEKEKEVQVNVLSKEDQEALATYKAEKKAKRDIMIQEIQANSSKEEWPDAELNAMSDAILQKVLNAVKKGKEGVTDYSMLGANGVINTNAEEKIEPMLPVF